MKAFLPLMFLGLSLSLPAKAMYIPECWTADGQPVGLGPNGTEIEDGKFILTIDAAKGTKEDLLRALDLANSGPIIGNGFPLVSGTSVTVFIQANDDRVPPNRENLRQETRNLLEELARVPGVSSINCSNVMRPYRGVR